SIRRAKRTGQGDERCAASIINPCVERPSLLTGTVLLTLLHEFPGPPQCRTNGETKNGNWFTPCNQQTRQLPLDRRNLDTRPFQNGTVRLAQAAYEERELPSGRLDPTRLAVLADALKDAGCTEARLLEHL